MAGTAEPFMKIQNVEAYQIFDSRGNPTVEAVLTLEDGIQGRGLVPSGASTGRHEAWELRDGNPGRFLGRSVFRAVRNVEEEIKPALCGLEVADQEGLDRRLIELDGTPNKSRLGANAILAVSMAASQAAACAENVPLHHYLGQGRGTLLPWPEIQIFGGGKHARGRIDVQDFMIVAPGAKSYDQTLEMTFNVFHQAARVLEDRGRLAGAADEGGYWPMFDSNEEALSALVESIERTGYEPGRDVAISLDIAATEFWRDGRYRFGLENRTFTSEEFAELLAGWVERYPILSLEDPMAEEDWEGWVLMNRRVGHRVQLIGDDLFTTDLARIQMGIDRGAANAVLIKLNQIGTVSETLAAIRLTQKAGWRPVISARSGETEDAFIAHLAVATNAGQLKVGSFCRSERMAKWNEVLRIKRQLGDRARFAGGGILEKRAS
jgi:enolase 1/2/3